MWQDILVYAVLISAGAMTAWRFYTKFTGASSCCGGGCTCKGSCGGAQRGASSPKEIQPLFKGGCGCSR